MLHADATRGLKHNLTVFVLQIPSRPSPLPEGVGRRGLNTWILRLGSSFLWVWAGSCVGQTSGWPGFSGLGCETTTHFDKKKNTQTIKDLESSTRTECFMSFFYDLVQN